MLRLLGAAISPPISARCYHRPATLYAGHSHWANVKYQKGRKDESKSNTFSKIAREISACVRASKGVTSPNENPALAAILKKARLANFPKERIDHAIAHGAGTGGASGSGATTADYEVYGPSRVAFIIATNSSNRNRIVSQLRAWAYKYDGNLQSHGAFNYLFQRRRQVIAVRCSASDEENFNDVAVASGAEDVRFEDGLASMSCSDEAWQFALEELQAIGLDARAESPEWVPRSTVLVDSAHQDEFDRALEALAEIDEVVYFVHNADFEHQ